MRKYIYLVRHGECLSNVNLLFGGSEDRLSDNGLKQAVLVAERFRDPGINGMYHSGILRTQKTAEEIEKVTGVKSEIKEFLKERRGGFSSDSKYEYTEYFDQLKLRLVEAKLFLENLSAKRAVVVSHAAFLKSLATYLILGDSLSQDLLDKFDDALVLENAGISKCMFNDEKQKWRIMSWNDTGHLR